MATETKTKSRDAEVQTAQPIAKLAASRLPIVGSLAKEFGVTSDQWRVLIDQIFPAAKSVEAIGMALAYCRARNLDIYKRPVHIVPMYSSALKRMVETVWPGIAEIRTTAHRTGNYAGIDPVKWGDVYERTFVEYLDTEIPGEQREHVIEVSFPDFAEVTVYRMVEGQRMPFTAQVFWEEAYATRGRGSDIPNEMWMKRPRGQLAKCVEAAALRMAFPEELGNTYAAEEMEGKTIDVAANVVAPPPKPSDILPPVPEDDPPKGGKTIEPDPSPPADQKEGGAAEQGVTAGTAPTYAIDGTLVASTDPLKDPINLKPGTLPAENTVDPSTGQLHKTDHPEGGENEVKHPATGETMTNTKPAPSMDAYWTRLNEELSAYEGEDEFNQAWTDYRVEEFFAGNQRALDKAEEVRRAHLKRIEGIQRQDAVAAGQGDLLAAPAPLLPEVPE